MRCAAAIGLLWTSAAMAADGANLDIIGYSPDSRFFAFEQYGIQDGSGFSYAEIFIVDLVDNSWVKGTPIHERSEADGGRLSDAHKSALARAAPLLHSLAIGDPAAILAANPAGEIVADRSRIIFDRWYRGMGPATPSPSDTSDIRYELSLAPVAVPQPEGCPDDMGRTVGFALHIKHQATGQTKEIHRDTTLPKSRGCVTGYDIDTIVAPAGNPSPGRMVALIATYRFGFEGYDRRFLAVPFVLDQ